MKKKINLTTNELLKRITVDSTTAIQLYDLAEKEYKLFKYQLRTLRELALCAYHQGWAMLDTKEWMVK